MTSEELLELFDGCRSAFRLETLQHYAAVDDADAQRRRAFREGRLLPPRPSKVEEMRLMRQEVAALGKRVHRVHVVEVPLSSYLRFELAVYSENIEAGEDVRIADRSAHPALGELDRDFLLFDADSDSPVVVWFRYTSDGRHLGWDRSDDPGDARQCRDQRDLALAHSVSLDEFRSRVGVAAGRV